MIFRSPYPDVVIHRRRCLAPHRRHRICRWAQLLLHRRPREGAHQVQGLPGCAGGVGSAPAHSVAERV